VHLLDLDFLLVVKLFALLEEGVEGDHGHPLRQRQSQDEILHCWFLRLHCKII
jgi:hypothetical protein